jgi:pyruvate dehydrogenase E2 component (dihydrolipoamide acetyltransferase)
MIEFKLPTLGADMDEGKLIEWRVKPGDKVKRGDVVAVVDTTKAAVDVEIWEEGTLHELIVQPGSKVPVGTVLALLLAPGENPETAVRPKIAPPIKPAAPARAEAPAATPAAAVAEVERRRVSPAARRQAEGLGVNLDQVKGTGPGGSVTFEDVERFRAEAPPTDKRAEMRKAIAAAMSRSKREIPHYYLAETIPMRRASDWLARENEKRPLTARILMAVLQLKAVALALQEFPDLNGFWRDGGYQPSSAIHVGVAISLRGGGLIAPAIHDVPDRPLDDLMANLVDLVKRARAGSLRSSEMSDPTITVTNLGEGGVDSTFAVIYPPQVAIVGFGRIALRPWVEGDAVRAVPTVIASLSADHRASDGHRGALFLAEIAKRLQEPEQL